MTASVKSFEASLDLAVESLLSLTEPHTVGIVLQFKNTQVFSNSWLTKYKISLIYLHII